MAIRKIAKLGHPILRRQADPVDINEITSETIQSLINDLIETCDDANGAGLAAPQIHESKRVVILDLEEDEDDHYTVWINPVLSPLTDEGMLTFEGCLSVPGLRGGVVRPHRISVTGYTRDGKRFERILEGFSAVVAQHECDHLDGVLYVDRVETSTLAFLEEHRKYADELLEINFEGEE